jgi:tRNA modification GTPase
LIAGLRVAIVGPPNAGKSTLANRLIGTDRVITSRQAGTTRDWVSETALIRGWPVTLTDTAGQRPTQCAIEAEAIRRGRQQAESADLILAVLDATTSPAARRDGLASAFEGIPSGRPRVVALNKSDVAAPATASDSSPPALPISALTGAGIEDLEACIESGLGLDLLTGDSPTAFLPSQLAGPTATGAADLP